MKKICYKKAIGLNIISCKLLNILALSLAPALTTKFGKCGAKLVSSGLSCLHSALTALLKATNNQSINIDDGLLNGIVFIDLKIAFNIIDQ